MIPPFKWAYFRTAYFWNSCQYLRLGTSLVSVWLRWRGEHTLSKIPVLHEKGVFIMRKKSIYNYFHKYSPDLPVPVPTVLNLAHTDTSLSSGHPHLHLLTPTHTAPSYTHPHLLISLPPSPSPSTSLYLHRPLPQLILNQTCYTYPSPPKTFPFICPSFLSYLTSTSLLLSLPPDLQPFCPVSLP